MDYKKLAIFVLLVLAVLVLALPAAAWFGGWGGWGGFGGAGISNYQNTAIGQVVVLAYIDAYTKLVSDMGGLSAQAAADAPSQSVTMSRAGRLYTAASEKSKVVRPLDARGDLHGKHPRTDPGPGGDL